MMIGKSEKEIRKIVDNWADAYFKGEIFGFGLSDEMGFATFFDDDMGNTDALPESVEDLHGVGYKADTHRAGQRVGRGFRVSAAFDNNPLIQGTMQRGLNVLPPNRIPEMGKIKIAVFPRRYYAIKKQLESYGLREYEDFLYYNFFVAFYNYFVQNKVLIWKASLCVTTRCTLKCKDCNMFMPFYKEPADIPYDILSSDLDMLFSRVDYVPWCGILGGEPLLYGELLKYLRRIKEYSHRMGEFLIDTNGSIIPDVDVFECAREMGNLRFMINNYNICGKYCETVNELVGKVKEYGISYTLRNYDWSEYRRKCAISDAQELKDHYIRCNQPFTSFWNNRFYTCQLPWSAAQCGIGFDDSEDYLDFSDPSVTGLDIVKAGLGHLPRGYTSNCAMCNGCDPELYEKIPKAAQL